MNLTCPCCHAKYPLEAALEGSAAGELEMLIAQAGPMARPLIAYLGLFRSKSRALSFDRGLRLAGEVLALHADPRVLGAALSETVEAMRAKRGTGDVRPLKNHNYLRQVLASVADRAEIIPQAIPSDIPVPPKGKRAQAIASLAEWGRGDWLRTLLADGLAALVALGLDGTPGAEIVTRTADVWHHVMMSSCTVEAVDSSRVKQAFSGLLKAVEKWPEPRAIWHHMPRRPERNKLPEPTRSQESIQADLENLEKMRRRVVGDVGLPEEKTIDEEARRQLLQEQARQLREQDGGL